MCIICYYSLSHIYQHGISPDIEIINTKGMWSVVGFSIYVYEGIGVLMPIMQASEVPEQFDDILFWAVLTLVFIYTGLGVVTYFAFGKM